RRAYRRVERIFLADGDALMARTELLIKVLEYIRVNFPECQRVTSYASPKSVLVKTPAELKALNELGLFMVYMGLESGSDKVLTMINKGETASEIVKAGLMVKEAGIKLSVTAICGLGGKALSDEHAIETARAFSEMKPHYIGLLTLMFRSDTQLRREWQAGKFNVLSTSEVALETLKFLENIDSEGSIVRSNHISNYWFLKGTLNSDREELIRTVKDALADGLDDIPPKFRGL
ncbi:MAG: radical SAM protein, partial [Oscillospiraceae bacterium]